MRTITTDGENDGIIRSPKPLPGYGFGYTPFEQSRRFRFGHEFTTIGTVFFPSPLPPSPAPRQGLAGNSGVQRLITGLGGGRTETVTTEHRKIYACQRTTTSEAGDNSRCNTCCRWRSSGLVCRHFVNCWLFDCDSNVVESRSC